MASSRHQTSTTTRLNPGYLAPPTQDNHQSTAFLGTIPKPSQQRQEQQARNFNNNDSIVLLSLDPISQPQNNPNSSDDDDGGDDDQDDESDSTDSSISTDTDANNFSPKISGQQLHHIERQDGINATNSLENNESDENEELIQSWPEGRPLPYPEWKEKSPEVAQFSDILHYEEFAGFVEFISQRIVAEHKYNTVENFIRFYRAYKKSKIDSLVSFYRQYEPPVTPCHYTCVGLAYELIAQMNNALPNNHSAINKFYVTSCEEAIERPETYIEKHPDRKTVEKEHVSVCLKIQIGDTKHGERKGYLLLDPGYHVSRVVTILDDEMYPHTGRFVQNDDGSTKKEYEYTLASPAYISWNITDTKKGKITSHTSLIFVAKEFLSGVDFAERRNLVYDFKSVLKRDPKGQVIAGLYFPLTKKNPKNMTIFFMENNNRTNVRIIVSRNVKETRDIQMCEEQMGLKRGKLTQIMNAVGSVMHDEGFMEQVLQLNQDIVLISAEN